MNDALAQTGIGDVAADPVHRELLPGGIDQQVADERLGKIQREARLQQRIVALQKAGAVRMGRVPRHAV